MQSIEKLQKLRDAGIPPAQAEAIVALLEEAAPAAQQHHNDFIDHKAQVAKYMARMDEIIRRHDQAHEDHKATMAKMDDDHKARMKRMEADSQKRTAEHEAP